MKEHTEQILAERLKNGDRAAMKSLYGLYSGYLNAVCSRYITDKDEIKDILQDSFLKIFSNIGQFRYRGEGSLRAWMSRITVNLSLKHLQAAAKRNILKASEDLPDIPDENVSDEDMEINDIPASVIQDMIRRLPAGYRTVFNLYVFEEMSHKEIAGLLDIKENSSASQLHRAKALLAGWIKDYRKEYGR